MTIYPAKLIAIISLFESLPEEEKRENLIAYAEQAAKHAPRKEETFDFEDVRKDEECTDTVGVFMKVSPERNVHFRLTLGEKVQTLTKAMTSILCRGLEGCTLEEVLDLPSDFVPRIVGGHLVRIRSQTVYYILTRTPVRPTQPPGWSPSRHFTSTSCAGARTASRTGSTAASRRSAPCRR